MRHALCVLVGDAFHANYQERVMKDNPATNTPGASMLEVMVFSNFYAACITVVVTLLKQTGTVNQLCACLKEIVTISLKFSN